MSDTEWKTLVVVQSRAEADVIKAALEAQGIQAELFQEAAGVVHGLTVGPMGEVEICVAPADLETAQTWLEAYQNDELEGFDEEHSDSAE